MLVEGVYNLILNDPGIAELVAGRVTAVLLPKNPTLPAITFYEINDSNDLNLDSTALTSTNIEINVWAKEDYFAAKRGQELLHALLDGFIGELSDGTVVKTTTSYNNPDFYEKDSLYHRSSTTFTFLT